MEHNMTLSTDPAYLAIYHAAMRADDGFTDAIRQVHGKRATRWTVDVHADPLTLAAYRAKCAADEALHEAILAARKGQ